MWLEGFAWHVWYKWRLILFSLQVRFNTLRVLPRTGKAVKAFAKF